MRNLIVFGVFLLLAITVIQTDGVPAPPQNFKFGDILAFPWKIGIIHYAIWVGDRKIETADGMYKRQADQDIFHFNVRIKGGRLTDCFFAKLTPSERAVASVDNYLDELLERKEFASLKLTEAQMEANIKEKIGRCGIWKAFYNNCEHLATYVRYGVKFAWQQGRLNGKLCENFGKMQRKILAVLMKKMKADPVEPACRDGPACSTSEG